MIYCLVGENLYARRQEIARLASGRDFVVRDSADLDVSDLATLLSGQSLFGGDDLIVIEDASSDEALWEQLGSLVDRLDQGKTLILCDYKLDKRTKTFKTLQKKARIIACDYWQVSQMSRAESWLSRYARDKELNIDPRLISDMVRRSIRNSELTEKSIIDQELLAHTIDQLTLVDGPVTDDLLSTILPQALYEDAFVLLQRAVTGDSNQLQDMIRHLSSTQDGYRTLGLLASQAVNLAALVMSDDPIEQVASDIGAHPYALRQLAPVAEQCSYARLTDIVSSLARADEQLRRKHGDPWRSIEAALMRIALKK